MRRKHILIMKYLGTTLKVIAYVLVAVVVLLAFLLVGMKLLGFEVYTVLSGSMEPEYHTGGLIYVKHVEPQSLEVGDDITFNITATQTATHRIIEIYPDESNPTELWFRTQGVANDVPDSAPVHESKIVGKAVFGLPLLGYLATYIQSPPGMYLAIAVGIALVLFVMLVDVVSDYIKKHDGEENGRQEAENTEEKSEENQQI